MSDTAKRDAVLMHHRGFDHRKSAYKPSTAEYEMAERIVELEAAIERVRALHNTYPDYKARWCRHCATQEWPCPTLRALEETP